MANEKEVVHAKIELAVGWYADGDGPKNTVTVKNTNKGVQIEIDKCTAETLWVNLDEWRDISDAVSAGIFFVTGKQAQS